MSEAIAAGRKAILALARSPAAYRPSAIFFLLLVCSPVIAQGLESMNTAGRRQERLGEQIRVELAEMMARELKDPRIGFATVTRVELSADLHHARVLVSVLGSPEDQQETIAGLTSAAGFMRHEIGRRLTLRRVPELSFDLDRGAEEGEKVELLLQRLRKEGGL